MAHPGGIWPVAPPQFPSLGESLALLDPIKIPGSSAVSTNTCITLGNTMTGRQSGLMKDQGMKLEGEGSKMVKDKGPEKRGEGGE